MRYGFAQYTLPIWEAHNTEIHQVAEKFVVANALNPQIARLQFPQDLPDPPKPSDCNAPKFEGELTDHSARYPIVETEVFGMK